MSDELKNPNNLNQIKTLMSSIADSLEAALLSPSSEERNKLEQLALMTTEKVSNIIDQMLSSTNVQPESKKNTLKILLAEDNEINTKVITRLLSRRGHAIITAANGKEALKEFSADKFDVVLMDLCMPVMDGTQAIREIRLLEEKNGSNRIPIIVISALDQEQAKKDLGKLIDDFISKPFNSSGLLGSIQKLVAV